MKKEGNPDHPIFRYEDSDRNEFDMNLGDSAHIELVEKHIKEHIGEVELVFHELVSDQVHIDVHWVKPNEKFPFHTLVTSGMSSKPMSLPKGYEELQYAELCILLPSEWPLDTDADKTNEVLKDFQYYWPIYWLKQIARLPHLYNSYIALGHTIPNGEEAEPFAENTDFGCMLILYSMSLPEAFRTLKIDEQKQVHFYCLYPLFRDEMLIKLRDGVDSIINRFMFHDISDVIDLKRLDTSGDV